MKKIATLTALFLGMPIALLARWRGGCYADSYWFDGPHWFGGHFLGGGLIMWILFLVILGFAIFFAVKYFRGGKQEFFKKEIPLDALKLRYAKGEITKEVYEDMKKELG